MCYHSTFYIECGWRLLSGSQSRDKRNLRGTGVQPVALFLNWQAFSKDAFVSHDFFSFWCLYYDNYSLHTFSLLLIIELILKRVIMLYEKLPIFKNKLNNVFFYILT